MGYTERHCQLCGLSFNVGRIRTAEEPVEAGYESSAYGNCPVEEENSACTSTDCSVQKRMLAEYMYHDGSVSEAHEIEEHIAGPSCNSSVGYSGHRISHEEMKDSRSVQCLLYKDGNWTPEPDDEDFVISSEDAFLTGISRGPPSEFEVSGFEPVRHGVKTTMIGNDADLGEDTGTPMHSNCFEIFKYLSLQTLGHVDIEGLRYLWAEGMDHVSDGSSPSYPDCKIVSEQFYRTEPGTEYLVADPVRVPGLDVLIDSCLVQADQASDVVFNPPTDEASVIDLFATLSPEIKLIIVLQLSRTDLAALRLASSSFRQLPQRYFYQLVRTEMPWVWETESLSPKQIDWYKLWCVLSAADGGSGRDQAERSWLQDAESPTLSWDRLRKQVSEEEAQRHGITPVPRVTTAWDPVAKSLPPEDQQNRMKALAKERRAAGRQWPKSTELKGLRNRRRIYGDVMKTVNDLLRIS